MPTRGEQWFTLLRMFPLIHYQRPGGLNDSLLHYSQEEKKLMPNNFWVKEIWSRFPLSLLIWRPLWLLWPFQGGGNFSSDNLDASRFLRRSRSSDGLLNLGVTNVPTWLELRSHWVIVPGSLFHPHKYLQLISFEITCIKWLDISLIYNIWTCSAISVDWTEPSSSYSTCAITALVPLPAVFRKLTVKLTFILQA